MKKEIKGNRKLTLTTETLKTLNPAELDQANGGIIWTVVPVAVAVTVLFCAPQRAR
ncbi:MAG: hypothetical protein H0V17_11785 [Deltaproteobacteria bacterium]|nr:hypothetical protein [Deltaproteobacteria bacterium]